MLGRDLGRTTVNASDVARFSVDVDWWDPNGVAGWLHRYNAVRVPYIREAVCRNFGRYGGVPQ